MQLITLLTRSARSTSVPCGCQRQRIGGHSLAARYHSGRLFSVYRSSSSEVHKFQESSLPATARRRIHSSRRSPIETPRKWRWQTTELQNRGDIESHSCGAGPFSVSRNETKWEIYFAPNCGVILEYLGSLGISMQHPSRHSLHSCKGQRAAPMLFQEQLTWFVHLHAA